MEALLSPELLSKMEDRDLSLARLYDMSATEIGAFLRHPAAGGWGCGWVLWDAGEGLSVRG